MIAVRIIAATTAVASVYVTANASADEFFSALTLKPRQCLSFDIGSKGAASHFDSSNEHVKLVLTLAELPSFGDDIAILTATRFEATTPPPRKSTRFRLSEGKSLEFTCWPHARLLSVSGIERLAGGVRR